MKTVAQFSAVRKGALDISLYPISYAGGEFSELNIGLMPGLVSSYKQGAAWKNAAVGQKFSDVPRREGRDHPVLDLAGRRRAPAAATRSSIPDDAKGMKIRGGSREMDMMLQAAGATTLSTPSNELYAAMQTGACDAAITSSTSLISFRLEEVAKSLTTGPRQVLLVHARAADHVEADFRRAAEGSSRTPSWRSAPEMEEFGTKEAMADDQKVAEVYAKKGAKVADLDDATVEKWRAIARDTAWKDYAGKTALSAELLKLAEGVHVS